MISKNRKKILIIIVVLFPLFYVIFWGIINIPSQSDLCKQGIELYKGHFFKGIVKEKYIDKENHMNKTVIIKNKTFEKTIYLDADIGGVYDYIVVGDSIEKKEGELFVRISRQNKDTIINFKFNCY